MVIATGDLLAPETGLLGGFFLYYYGGAIIFTLIWFARQISSQKHDSAVELVRKRYAAGEISQQEFDGMTAELS